MKKGSKPGVPLIAGVIVGGIERDAVRKAVGSGAGLLEIRVDTFRETDGAGLVKDLEKLKKITDLPVLVTIRSKKEGGVCSMPDGKRAELYRVLAPFSDFIDIELSSGAILKNVVNSAKRSRKKLIISYHNFKSTPSDTVLRDIVRRGRSSGGDIVKIAAYARGVEDLRRLAKILLDFKDLIVIAMGAHGAASRVFFPMLGSAVTYGSVTRPTAPGQMSLRDLKKELKKYGF